MGAAVEHRDGSVVGAILSTQITDTELEHLKGFTQLEWLDLSRTQITDAELEHLKGLTSLTRLDLHRTQIRRRTPTRWVAKDLAGLLYSSHFGPARLPLTSRDIVRFLKVYRGGDWRQSLRRDRALWRRVGKRVCRDHRREFGREPLLPTLLRGRTP